MLGFLTTYLMLLIFGAVVAYAIVVYQAPTSLKNSAKEVAQSVAIYLIVFCLFNAIMVGTDISEWPRKYVIPLLFFAAIIRLFVDWWILRRRQNEEAS